MRYFLLIATLMGCLINPFSANAEDTEPNGEQLQQIQQSIKLKEQAVRTKDEELFISLIDPQNKKYLKEATNWFRDAIIYLDPNSYHLSIIKVIPLDRSRFKVTLSQNYNKNGKSYEHIYDTLLFKGEEGTLDGDVFFNQIKKNHIAVKFDHLSLQSMAQDGAGVLVQAVDYFKDKFKWEPQTEMELKLYSNPELFRQSVKLSLPTWVGGWNEYGESIKWVGKTEYDSLTFHSGLVHEVTHQMLGEMTNDNAAYWMHEGLATYHEMEWIKRELGQKVTLEPRPVLWTAQEMMNIRLEELDRDDAEVYYYQAYLMVRLLTEHYGEQAILKWMLELKKNTYIEGTTLEKLHLSNERTIKAFEISTGDLFNAFADEWNERYLKKGEQ